MSQFRQTRGISLLQTTIMMSWGSLKGLPWSKTLDIFTLTLNFLEWYDKKSLSGFYPISKRKHCMTLQFLNLDTLHQRLRIHSYVTGCTTERVWGGGEGPLIIAFSSWPGLLVLNMCIVRLYLKTFWNHQTVFIFTFVSMKFSDNSTGTFNQKLTCWRIKLEAKD